MTRSALGNSAVLGKAMALLSTLLLLSVWGAAGPVWAQSPDPTPASPPTTAPAPASPSPASPSLASPPSAAPAPIEMPDLGLGPRASVEPELEPVQPLVADLSDHLIAITTAFTGTDVLLFGATDGPGDVVMVVRGPITSKVVRRKDRIGGLVWANHDSVTFEEIPSFYRVASSRPLDEFAPEIVLQRHQIGLENLTLPLADEDAEDMDPEEQQLFRDALLRLMQTEDLYGDVGVGQINHLANRLFRSQLYFPATVPVGSYNVEVYLFRNGEVAQAEITPLIIGKDGLGADIYDFAYEQSLLYGALAVIAAIMAGYLAGIAFRKS